MLSEKPEDEYSSRELGRRLKKVPAGVGNTALDVLKERYGSLYGFFEMHKDHFKIDRSTFGSTNREFKVQLAKREEVGDPLMQAESSNVGAVDKNDVWVKRLKAEFMTVKELRDELKHLGIRSSETRSMRKSELVDKFLEFSDK